MTIRHNAIRQAKQQHDKPYKEGNVAQPIDLLFAIGLRRLTQLQVGPRGSEETEGHADEKDEAPVDSGKDTTQD